MTTTSSTDFGPREGRKFGFQVGTAFAVLAVLLVWRDHDVAALVCGSLAAFLWAGGLVAPGRMGPVQRAWMRLALAISKVTNPIFMGIVYFLVLTPTGLLRRTLGRNPLVHRLDERDGYWIRRDPERRGDMRRQF